LGKAANLTTQFNQVDQRLTKLNDGLNKTIQDQTGQANTLLSQIADLNDQISRAEVNAPGTANDLRDTRQSRIEDLAKLVKIDLADGSHGAVNVSVAGTLMVSDNQVSQTLETFDPGSGQLAVRATGTTTALALTGGSIQGTIDARDGAVAQLRQGVNSLASLLITEVNNLHTGGISLTGSTGAKFFNGTDAGDIQVNAALANDPSLIQAASVAGAPGDNGTALALGQLAQKTHASLGNQTFTQGYAQTATAFGHALSAVNTQLSDQQLVEKMLLQRRDSISGVSMDEEMTDLTKFQKAFEASAKLITTVDDLLETVVNLKQ
jgi:flagellar hook-associated protein 1 FlgK